MSKALRKAIMVRSKLEDKYNKNRNGENWDSYKKRNKRNFCAYEGKLKRTTSIIQTLRILLTTRHFGKLQSHTSRIKA